MKASFFLSAAALFTFSFAAPLKRGVELPKLPLPETPVDSLAEHLPVDAPVKRADLPIPELPTPKLPVDVPVRRLRRAEVPKLPVPTPKLPVDVPVKRGADDLPSVLDIIHELSLPLGSSLSEIDIKTLVETLEGILAGHNKTESGPPVGGPAGKEQ